MHEALGDDKKNKKTMIISYLRDYTPKSYGERPTKEEAEKVRKTLNVAPDISPEGYIAILEMSGDKVKKKKRETTINMFKTARSYWRSKRKPRVGVVIAFKEEKDIRIGWSLCKTAAGDRFNRYIGVDKALKESVSIIDLSDIIARTQSEIDCAKLAGRKPDPSKLEVPHTLIPHLKSMMERAKRQLS
jgi:hypothetical protein